MTFSEAETLFHEFGHGLQHMLTHVEEPRLLLIQVLLMSAESDCQVQDGDCAGINNVEWDAVDTCQIFVPHRVRSFQHGSIRPHWMYRLDSGAPLPVHGELAVPQTYCGLLRRALRNWGATACGHLREDQRTPAACMPAERTL